MVDGAALADILDDSEAWEAPAGAVDDILIDAAGVDVRALLKDGVVLGSFSAFAAEAVDGDEAGEAVAVEGVGVEDFVVAASVAVGTIAVFDL